MPNRARISRCCLGVLCSIAAALTPWGCGSPEPVPAPAAQPEPPPELTDREPPRPEPPVPADADTVAAANTMAVAPAPVPPPAEAVPATPAPEESAPEASEKSKAEDEKKAEKPGLTSARLKDLKEGLTYEEVVAQIGAPGFTISGSGSETVLYQWSSEDTRFLARFEQGKLTGKSVDRAVPDAGDTNLKPELTKEQYDGVTVGMPIEEVLALLDVEAKVVTDGGRDYAIYKWTDKLGSNFTARFEDGKLVRKTGFYVAPLDKSKETPESEPPSEDEEPGTDEFPDDSREEAPAEEGEPALPVEEPAPPAPEAPVAAEPAAPEPEPSAPEVQQPVAPARDPRVRVTGSTRRAREAETEVSPVAGRSYKPKAKLPKFTYSLRRGVYEVRIHNTSNSTAKVGVRKGNRGKDAAIPPGQTKSFYVDQGSYETYYVIKDDPYTLQRGPGIIIDGLYLSNLELFLFDQYAPGPER